MPTSSGSDVNSLPNSSIATTTGECEQSQETLNEAAALLAKAEQIAQLGSWQMDIVTEKVMWSKELFRIFGLQPRPQGLSVQEYRKLIHPDDVNLVSKIMIELFSTGNLNDKVSIDYRIILNDGSVRTLHSERMVKETTKEGKPKVIVGIEQDITERKKAEEKNLRNIAIQEGIKKIFQEALSRRTEETLGELCLTIAEDLTQSKLGVIGEVNEQELPNTFKNNIVQGEIKIIFAHGYDKPSNNLKIQGLFGKILCEGKGFFTNSPANHPERAGVPTGHPKLTAFLGVPLMSRGKPVGMIAVSNREGGYSQNELEALDMIAPAIVEAFLRKRAEAKLEQYSKNLEELVEERTRKLRDTERLATIGQVAGMVGHDLRNPLQSIVGEIYLATTELKALPESEQKNSLRESIEAIAEQAAYMDKIVSDLQAFVKPVDVHKQTINIKSLIAARLAEIDIPENVKTHVSVEDEHLTIEADPQLLKRVLINLLTNAVQAMPDGGGLTVKAQNNKQGQVQIIVEDTGVGIAEAIRPKIFTPLFTTKAKGQGFGLAVCKRVLESQGGTITFESQEGKGAKFILSLPLKK